MGTSSTPALAPVGCLLAGALIAVELPQGPDRHLIPLAVLLIALGWAWGSRAGRLVAWTAVGVVLILARPESALACLESLDPTRPVSLVGRPQADWRSSDAGWRARLAVERVRQGSSVLRCRAVVTLEAGGVAAPPTSERMRVKGYLKRSRPTRNPIGRQPLDPPWPGRYRMFLKSPRFVLVDEAGASGSGGQAVAASPAGGAARLRSWVREGFAGVEDRSGVRVARALLLGEREALGGELRRSLRRSGLAHLLAVSGLHVALVGLFAHWLLRGVPRPLRSMLTALVVLCYLVLVGARPSIVRATAMFLLAYGATSSHRPPHSRQALCLAAGFLVAVDPALISDLGFRLSVSATAGILWLAPALEERWVRLPRVLCRPLAATAAAQLASIPWTVPAFSIVHPLAPVMNLLAVPWMATFAVLSLAGATVMKCLPWSRSAVATALDLAVQPLAWLELLPAGRWLTLPVACGPFGALLLAAGLMAALLARTAALRWAGAGIAALALLGPSMPSTAEMVVIDVGQGDAILLHDGRRAVLVDGGGWRSSDIAASVLVPTLARLGVRRLDAAIVTHADIDHCRGLLDLSYYVPIGRIATPPGVGGSRCVRRLVARPGARWRELWSGQTLRFGRIGLEVLHPTAGSIDRGNDSSLVLQAVLGGRSLLLTGDIEAGAERALLARRSPAGLASDVLKLAHHGSKTSTTQRFLEAVRPAVAVVSSGRGNHYGHPARLVVERCRRRGVRLLRTDRDGMIRLPLEPVRPSGSWPGAAHLPWLRLGGHERAAGDSRADGDRKERPRDELELQSRR